MFVRVSYTDGIIFMVKILARGEHHMAVSYVPDLATSTIKTIVINRGISQQIPNYMLKSIFNHQVNNGSL